MSDRYEIGSVLGAGGMGEVRSAWDRRLHRRVAMKILRRELAAQRETRRRFEHEGRMAARLVNPHIVAVFDAGEDGETSYLVMEELSGRTLADAIDEGPLDPEAVRALGLQVLDGLDAAHQVGLVHRDIKPSNVLAAGPGAWKVGDFGIAKSAEATDPSLTSTGLIIGTVAYLPPERLGGAAATPSGDLYAVGAVLYEALLGQRARRMEGAPGALVPERPRIGEIRPGLPPGLISVIERAMAPEPSDRFASAAAMAAALRQSDTLPATVAFADSTVTPTALMSPLLMTPAARLRASTARQRWVVGAAVVSLLIVVAIIALVIANGHGRTPTHTPPRKSQTSTTVTTPTTVTSTTSTTIPATTTPTHPTPPTKPTKTKPTARPGP